MNSRCYVCKEPATALCDWVVEIPRTVTDDNGVPRILNKKQQMTEAKTCDKAFCRKHGKRVGHFCMADRRKSDTVDYCLEHET